MPAPPSSDPTSSDHLLPQAGEGDAAVLRKGWCPGALRPMRAADGLIVRIKPPCGILPAATARALADLAERHGNGRLDLTIHANLQLRGVHEAALPALLAALDALGLLDASAEAEAVRNVVASPLAGLHDGPDIRPLVAALEARLATTPALHALPGKFGFLVDDGGAPSLADVAADVRFDWAGEGFAIGLGGTRARAVAVGACEADALIARAEAIARAALALFASVPEARRMRDLVAALGGEIVAEACGSNNGRKPPSPLAGEGARRADEGASPERSRPQGRAPSGNTPSSAGFAGTFSREGRRGFPLALAPPYGRLDAGMLRLAADLADTDIAAGELRLTPWRSLLVPGAAASARGRARRAGFIVDPDDPRLAVAACVGAPDCSRATTSTRADANALAETLADLAVAPSGGGPRLHVSGCAKGCALAAPAPVTLVGRDGLYDLVVDGRAGDAPAHRGLDLAAARAAIGALTSRAASAPPAARPSGSNRA